MTTMADLRESVARELVRMVGYETGAVYDISPNIREHYNKTAEVIIDMVSKAVGGMSKDDQELFRVGTTR